jgi:hypothetical protein
VGPIPVPSFIRSDRCSCCSCSVRSVAWDWIHGKVKSDQKKGQGKKMIRKKWS